MSKVVLTAIFLILCSIIGLKAESAEDLSLAGMFSEEFLSENLVPADSFRPYPDISERSFWENVPDSIGKKLVREADSFTDEPWPLMTATDYLDFHRKGTAYDYESKYFERRRRLAWLVLAECITGSGKYLDDIVDGIWLICEESSWTMPGHIKDQKAGPGLPDSEENFVAIFSAETGALMAWTYYLLADRLDRVSPLVRKRIRYEVRRRILDPSLERDDFWWQSFNTEYINNWNTWTNTSWLTMLFILENDHERLVHSVYKSLRSLDRFISHYPSDGGCDEGPLYWGKSPGGLFECLELLYWATDGKIDLFSDEFIKLMGQYICNVHIADEYFVNFADSPAKVHIWANLVYRYGKRIGNLEMMNLGAKISQRGIGKDYLEVASLGRIMPALLQFDEINTFPVTDINPVDVWMDEIQVMTARSSADAEREIFIGAKGGFNEENHNHNDVGHFILYVDGKPAIVDLGVGRYTRDTFSDKRYTIWTMQSAWHNLPTVNGMMQSAGPQFRASGVECRFDEKNVNFSLDIAGSYPVEAGVKSWKRKLHFNRDNIVTLSERFILSNRSDEIFLSFITPCNVSVEESTGCRLINNGTVMLDMRHEAGKFSIEVDSVDIEDPKLQKSWGDKIYRVRLILKDKKCLEDDWDIKFIAP